MNSKDFPQLTFFLVSNYHTYGVQHAMLAFLIARKAKKVYFLNHPLHDIVREGQTVLEVYGQGRRKGKQEYQRKSAAPGLIRYLADLFITIRIGLSMDPVDVYVGFNSVNTVAGLLLKLLGKVKIVITYSHSYKGQRYNNVILNGLYKLVDGMAVRFSDSVWGLSDTLKTIRKAQGVPADKIVVAHDGVDTALIRPVRFSKGKQYSLVFVGLINEINGLDLVIEALPALIKWNGDVRLLVIGEGERLSQIKKRVSVLKLNRYVRFLGIQSIQSLAKILPVQGIGIATYKPMVNSTLRTTDPMKTKLYMAAGLPIISTDLYATAKEISTQKIGMLIEYKTGQFISAVKRLTRESVYKTVSANGVLFSKKYDWDTIFEKAFLAVRDDV